MASRAFTGATITFGTSSFTAKLISVGGAGASRAVIDTTDMTDLGTDQSATVAGIDLTGVVVRTFDSGSVTFKPIEVTVSYDPDQVFPIGAPNETITLKAKPIGVQTVGAGFSFSGFVADGDAFTGELDGSMTASMTLQPVKEYTWIDAV